MCCCGHLCFCVDVCFHVSRVDSRTELPGFMVQFTSTFLRNCQAVSHSGWTVSCPPPSPGCAGKALVLPPALGVLACWCQVVARAGSVRASLVAGVFTPFSTHTRHFISRGSGSFSGWGAARVLREPRRPDQRGSEGTGRRRSSGPRAPRRGQHGGGPAAH